ncbi:hypothetical protein D3C71_821230 [compost metagenome]
MQLGQAITEALCPEPLLRQGVAWAIRPVTAEEEPEDETEREMLDRAKLIVAALVLRDGSPELRDAHGRWASEHLASSADGAANEYRPRQYRYNSLAIVLTGLLAAYRQDPATADLPRLLALAVRPRADIVGVIRHELNAGRVISEDLKSSLVRLALSASIYAVRQRLEDLDVIPDFQAQEAARKTVDCYRRQAAASAELAWLVGQSPEPLCPEFPPSNEARPRRGIRIGTSTIQPDNPSSRGVLALDDSRAAKVLEVAVDLWRDSNPERLGDLVRHAWPWTASANGVGAPKGWEPAEHAYEWNHAYFPAALAAAVALGPEHIPGYVTERLSQLPEERLLMAAGGTLRQLDQLWLGSHAIADDVAVGVRDSITRQVQGTRHWHRMTTERSTGIASDAAETIAAMFMCDYNLGKVTSYVLPRGMSRTDLCLTQLERSAVEASGSTFVALAILSLLEVEPHPSRLDTLARVVAAWWNAHGADAGFWTSYGVAQRICAWIDRGVLASGAQATVLAGQDLASILDVLIRCGGPAARALEERVTSASGDPLRASLIKK